ncbi:MAG: carbohydrate-binding protein [Planctomycetota bacterium]|nr:carbohydrate-binding protein [Planctomycetota bacterium]
MQRPGLRVLLCVLAGWATACRDTRAQTGRTVSMVEPPQLGRALELSVDHGGAANGHLGWFAITGHAAGTSAWPIPGLRTFGAVRIATNQILALAPWASPTPTGAGLTLRLPNDPALLALPFDVQAFDIDLGTASLYWSDNDLELAVGATGCGSQLGITALYPPGIPKEPDVVVDTPTSRTTFLADRARDRHAREDIVNGIPFRAYDHWLPFYWEQRIAELEIVDTVGRGGSTVRFRFMTHDRLNPAEFRTFYANQPSVAVYHNNMSTPPGTGVTLISTSPSTRYPGETEYLYEATITQKIPEYRPLQVGDRMEVELSQFLAAPRNGRANYYGTAFLYVVGEGVQPWYAKAKEEATTPAQRAAASFDSFPLPAVARLGGDTTLPYHYSGEPQHRFKQMAGNVAPASGHEFVLGRRLHHTDFSTGAHSEPGNPTFAAHAGQLGPKFIAASCVACHVGNGRSLPPAVGEPLTRAVVRVGTDARGTPHPTLGEVLQPSMGSGSGSGGVDTRIEAESYVAMSGVQTEPTQDVGGGLNVTSIDTRDWMSFANQPVTLPADALYRVELRVASASSGGILAFEESGGAIIHSRIPIPATGGAQTWQTVTTDVFMTAGSHVFGLNANVGGFNLNWFRVSSLPQGGGGGGGGGGANSEGLARLDGYDLFPGTYADGTTYELRAPRYVFEGANPQFFSVRNAPPLIGTGLLEAIDEATLLVRHDPCDADSDGISGRLATATELASVQPKAGRIGTKAQRASVIDQVATALNHDMGIASDLMPVLDGETSPSPAEVTPTELDRMARYAALLGVPARRSLTDAAALRGEQVFASMGCVACHVPELRTGTTHPYGELRGQTIRPYTDLLLHDMGPGLADNMGDGDATGSEWRTTPLWGIGHTADVAGGEAYLHDGRARTLEEAILWHGGEGETAKQAFRSLTAADRAAVVAFLRSL